MTPFRAAGTIGPRWRAIAAITAALLLSGPAAAAAAGRTDGGLAGLRLVDALERLREAGLPLVWSSDVVPDHLRVVAEPGGNTPRRILENLLDPFGLVAEETAGGLLLIRPRPLSITGVVISQGSGRPVVGARVVVSGTSTAAVSDDEGRFAITDIRARPLHLRVEATGFLPRELTLQPRATDRVLRVTLELAGIPLLEREITVHPTGPARPGTASDDPTRVAGTEELESLPSLGADVLRALPRLAGVTASDNSAQAVIRGAEPRDVTYLLDGVELFEPYHLGGLQAPFSLIDSSLARRVRVLVGPQSAEHGDRFGGIVDITTRQPQAPFRVHGSAGTLESSAGVEGRTRAGRVSWMASVRRWYPGEWIDTVQAGVEGLEPTLDDGFGKVSWTAAPGLVMFAEGLVGHDVVHFAAPEEGDRADARSRSRYLWGGFVASIGPRVIVRTVAYDARWRRLRQGTGEIGAGDGVIRVDDTRRTTGWGLRQDWSLLVPGRVALAAGWEYRSLRTRFLYASTTLDPAGERVAARRVQISPRDRSLAAYADLSASIHPRVTVSAGLRWQRHRTPDEGWIDPRASLRWDAARGTRVTLGAGVVHESERPYELQVEDGVDSLHPAERARRLSASIEQFLGSRVRARLEAWQDRLTRLRPRYENAFNPIDLFPEGQPDRVRIAPDVARLEGIELSLAGSGGLRPWSWWLSLARTRAVDRERGRWIPRAWDQPWVFEGHVSWQHHGLRFSAAATARTGWPRTPLTPDGSRGGTIVAGPLRASRFAPYQRLDVSLERSFEVRDSRLTARVTLLDLLNRHNECCWGGSGPEPTAAGGTSIPEIDRWRGRSLLLRLAWTFPTADNPRRETPRGPTGPSPRRYSR